MTGRSLHHLLAQQLRRLGLDTARPPAARPWQRLLGEISETYDARFAAASPARPSAAGVEPDPTASPAPPRPRSPRPDVDTEAHLQALVQALPDLILLFDEEGRCLDTLPQQGLREAGGPHLAAAAVRERLLAMAEPEGEAAAFQQAIRAALATNTIQVLEYELEPARDARIFEARVLPTGLMLAGRRTVVVLARDVTDSVQARQRLQYHATHDPLTGLANRRLLEERLTAAVARARRTATHGAVILLDLDRFKHINDRLGHALGDRVLQAAADRLRAVTRRQDLIARLGGDEFVLVLEDLPQAEAAAAIAPQILAAFAEPIALAATDTDAAVEVTLSASLGTAVFPEDGDTASALLHQADAAMYAAKPAR